MAPHTPGPELIAAATTVTFKQKLSKWTVVFRHRKSVFTLVPSTSKFNLTPNWWASRNYPDHSLTLSTKLTPSPM